MESPMNIEAPTTPSASSGKLRRPSARCPSAIRDKVPPSPLLSARNSSSTYFAVTTMNSDHRISESTPRTMTRDTGAPFAAWVTASRNAYNGEVPISPNTTPILPSVRAQKPEVACPSWASVDVTLTVMIEGNVLVVELIRAIDASALPVNHPTSISPRAAELTQRNFTRRRDGIMVVPLCYGFRLGGSGGF